MKKIYLLKLIFLTLITSGFRNLSYSREFAERGCWEFSGGISFNHTLRDYNAPSDANVIGQRKFEFNFSPKVGYFLLDNLEIEYIHDFEFIAKEYRLREPNNTYESSTGVNFSTRLQISYYFLKKETLFFYLGISYNTGYIKEGLSIGFKNNFSKKVLLGLELELIQWENSLERNIPGRVFFHYGFFI